MASEITTDPPAEEPRDAPVNIRTALGADAIGEALINNLHCPQAKLRQHATRNDWCMPLADATRDRTMNLGRYSTSMENGAAA
jgi:hypothetical protein